MILILKRERGLKTHIGHAHKKIPQVDGSDELDNLFSFESEFAQEDVEYTLDEALSSEVCVELISRVKIGDVKGANYMYTVSVCPPDKDWQWPKMSEIQKDVFRNLRNGC